MPFKLKKQKCQVTHLNVRDEKHGDDMVLAEDIKIEADVPNKFLDELSPGLRAALFTKEGDPQVDIDKDHLTMLRFPQIAPLKWKVRRDAARGLAAFRENRGQTQNQAKA